MVKIIKIHNCILCPFHTYGGTISSDSDDHGICFHNGRVLSLYGIDINKIPDFCPLSSIDLIKIELKAKLYELVAATEWRDECTAARQFCVSKLKEVYWHDMSKEMHRWLRASNRSLLLLKKAEMDYQIALMMAKEKEPE
jgi:hypothetical protein